MAEGILERMFAHNYWANLRMIEACATLSDAQLDAAPKSATKGSIRQTLTHLISAELGYLELLTLPVDERPHEVPPYNDLFHAESAAGKALVNLVRDKDIQVTQARLRTSDGYWVEPWVVVLQVINHASEHREQISSMLTSLGVVPPDLDGWAYGETTGALKSIST